MQPASIQIGDKQVFCVPKYSSRGESYSVRYQFYELVDGKLVEIAVQSAETSE